MVAPVAFRTALAMDEAVDTVGGSPMPMTPRARCAGVSMIMMSIFGMSDIPKIDIVLNNMPERGVIGIGEPPTVSTASAIANAVRNATGATIRSLPLHPHKVLAALEQQKAGGT